MDAMNIKIDGLVFDRANYDADGDVLYLARGESGGAADAAVTPEGHGLRYDSEGRVIGVTIINARWLLERDGHVTITLPHEVQVAAGDLAGALS
jgi:YD repeat-containing protein